MTAGGDLDKTIRQRRSVRRFKATPVPKDLVRRIIESGTWAPSAGNRQQWEFTVVISEKVRRQMAEAVRDRWTSILASAAVSVVGEIKEYSGNFDWFSTAPVVIAVSARGPDAFLSHLLGDNAVDVAGTKTSAAMAAQNLMLAAHSLGLGTCCLTGPLAAQEELKRAVGLGKRQTIVCLVALGYPAEDPAEKPRKPLDEVMRTVE